MPSRLRPAHASLMKMAIARPRLPSQWLAPLSGAHLPGLPAPLAMKEEAHYSVGYGVIGSIGELRLRIDDEHREGGRRLIKVAGYGTGAILGIGRTEKRVDGDFDPFALSSRRWTMVRSGGDPFTDTIEQPQAGTVNMTRQRPGVPQAQRQATFSQTTLDPVGLLMSVRVAPPTADHPVVLQLLDGQALWKVTLTRVGRELVPDSDNPQSAVRIDGQADPIFYDGRPAEDRPRRRFTLWLSDDDARIPLRLEMPIGPADVVVELTELTRSPRTSASQ